MVLKKAVLEKVISGGQTGADRAALFAAREAGLETGGWMPLGFLAYDGEHPEFASLFGMVETASSRYPPRTAMNVKTSDATLRFATNWNSAGEILTLNLCERYGKPNLAVTPGGKLVPGDVATWILENRVQVLNVAGNAERTSPGIQDYVISFLGEVFNVLRLSSPVQKARRSFRSQD